MEALESFVGALNGILWGPIMLVVLVGTGIFFSFRTRFVQVRRFGAAMKRVFGGFSLQGAKAGKDGMSSFQALTTAIAAQVGTGNIAGCLLFFAFSTIIGWYFFGKQNVTDLFGARAVMPYSIIVVICILIGSMLKVTLVWDMSDMFNGLMVIPNLIGVLALNGIVAAEMGRFDKK